MPRSSELSSHHFTATDGIDLVWHETGEGHPLVLIHGFFSSALVNWIRYGHATLLAEAGFRVIMPDLRGHGQSAKPHESEAYPPDILADDGLELIRALGLEDGGYDIGGYSLGARTTIRMLARGAMPRRVVLSGMGLSGILDSARRSEYFRHVLTHRGSFPRGSSEWMAEAFLKTTGSDPIALLHIVDTFTNTQEEVLKGLNFPTLVATGIEDDDNGSAKELAAVLPDARYVPLPGNHMGAVTRPELGRAFIEFLTA